MKSKAERLRRQATLLGWARLRVFPWAGKAPRARSPRCGAAMLSGRDHRTQRALRRAVYAGRPSGRDYQSRGAPRRALHAGSRPVRRRGKRRGALKRSGGAAARCRHADARGHREVHEGPLPHPPDGEVPEPGRRGVQGLRQGHDGQLQYVRAARRGRQVGAVWGEGAGVRGRRGRSSGSRLSEPRHRPVEAPGGWSVTSAVVTVLVSVTDLVSVTVPCGDCPRDCSHVSDCPSVSDCPLW